MVIMPENGILFLHIPRTGGTSISHSLIETGKPCLTLCDMGVKNGSQAGRMSDITYDPRRLLHAGQEYLSSILCLSGYYKITVVRNPWDRFVSMFSANRARNRRKVALPFSRFLEEMSERILRRNNSQSSYISYRQEFDWIGQFENITDTWNHICAKLEISTTPLPRLNYYGRAKDYRSYYKQTRLVDLVGDMEGPMIDQFGYKF